VYWHKTVFHGVVTEMSYLCFVLGTEWEHSISHSPAWQLLSTIDFSMGHYQKWSKFYLSCSTGLSFVGSEEEQTIVCSHICEINTAFCQICVYFVPFAEECFGCDFLRWKKSTFWISLLYLNSEIILCLCAQVHGGCH